jgi:hypothetical protein
MRLEARLSPSRTGRPQGGGKVLSSSGDRGRAGRRREGDRRRGRAARGAGAGEAQSASLDLSIRASRVPNFKTAYERLRSVGQEQWSAYFSEQLAKAKEIRDRFRGR